MYYFRCLLFSLNRGFRLSCTHFRLWLFLITDDDGIAVQYTFWEWLSENGKHFLQEDICDEQ